MPGIGPCRNKWLKQAHEENITQSFIWQADLFKNQQSGNGTSGQ